MNDKIQYIKNLLEKYLSSGHKLDDLPKYPEYNLIKNAQIYDEIGRRLTISEKIKLAGFDYISHKKTKEENIAILKLWFNKFIESGGNLSSLGSNDIHYKKLKDLDIFDKNGRRLSLAEKFTLMGFKRNPKHNDFESISEALDSLDQFKDENGFVDSYRKDKYICHRVEVCTDIYKLPSSLIVALLADKKLKKYYLNINRGDYLKYELSKYIEHHGDLVGLKAKNRKLYDQLNSYRRSYPSKTGEQISMQQLVDELGFTNIPSSFLTVTKYTQFNETEFFLKYGSKIKENKNKISISDIEFVDYCRLTEYLRRSNISLADYFAQFGINYLIPKNVARNNLVSTSHYPFLEEMKKERDELIRDYFSKYPKMENTDKATLFTIKLQACQFVYEKYKPLIIEKYSGDDSQPEKV